MKYLIIALLFVSMPVLSGDYFYVKLGAGINQSIFSQDKSLEWEDRDSLGALIGAGYRHHISGNFYGDLKYLHLSQWFVGPPFNDESESEVDHIGYSVEYRFE